MRESLVLAGLSLLIALLCFGIVLWTLLGGAGITMDNLLLIATCATVGAVFAGFGAFALRETRRGRPDGK